MSVIQKFFIPLAAFALVVHAAPLDAKGKSRSRPTPKKQAAVTRQEPRTIPEIIERSGLGRGRASIQIVSMPEGRVLYEMNPDLALNPASNAKLVTAAAAMHTLGPDFTFKTEFYATSLLRNGTLPNLWIKGFGDPQFVTEELDSVRGRFRAAGLRRIQGSISVDDTYFDRYPLTTYMSDANEKIYTIATGPLSFNFNSIMIKARPGLRLGDQPVLTTDPPTRFVRFNNLATTTGRGRSVIDAQNSEKDKQTVTIRGSLPKTIREFSFRHGILDPAIYTGTVIMEALQEDGVSIGGTVKREPVPSNAVLVLAHSSPPLREILKSLGKFSNNFSAEQIVKTLGAVRLGPPGSTASGIRVMKDYLSSIGVRDGTYVLDNGSGLSKLSRLSASQLVRVLLSIHRAPWGGDLIRSLSVAGEDGTLRKRLRGSPLSGRVLAKTGTLNGVSSLSGYVTNTDGTKMIMAFSFLFNETGLSPDKLSRLEDQILQAALRL